MNAAILCPGAPPPPDWRDCIDLTIAVNRAATAHRCDVFAALDFPLVKKIGAEVLGSPILLTKRASAHSLTRHDMAWCGEVVAIESLDYPESSAWKLYSLPSAIVYAATSGADSIKVYGAVWAGTADWDGEQAGGDRSPERWTRERNIFEGLVEQLKGRGVILERFIHEPAE